MFWKYFLSLRKRLFKQALGFLFLLCILTTAWAGFDPKADALWALHCQDQQMISAFDLDDTVLATPTRIYLFLKEGIEPSKDKPKEIALSTQEFAELRRPDHTFIGYPDYEMRYPPDQRGRDFSFRDFRDYVNPFIFNQDFKRGYESGHWRAVRWRQFVRASSTQAEADCTLIITTRGHAAFRIRRVFFKLRRADYLQYVLPVDNIYALSNEKYGYTTAQQVFDAKVEVMRIKLDLMQQMGADTSFLEVWNSEGTTKKRMRIFQYTDDDKVNLTKMKKTVLMDLAANPERWSHVKIRFNYTGNPHKADDPAWSVILMPGGKERLMMDKEIGEETRIHQRVVRQAHRGRSNLKSCMALMEQ